MTTHLIYDVSSNVISNASSKNDFEELTESLEPLVYIDIVARGATEHKLRGCFCKSIITLWLFDYLFALSGSSFFFYLFNTQSKRVLYIAMSTFISAEPLTWKRDAKTELSFSAGPRAHAIHHGRTPRRRGETVAGVARAPPAACREWTPRPAVNLLFQRASPASRSKHPVADDLQRDKQRVLYLMEMSFYP
ncbi:hypothetical protein EVAR_29336_1 [Eumeta japonica]|uniref:Uncharacterized protein n=1 Tax=Eumeta variegata TaxID=151549 RepID=A0A4C1WKA0_EUMVA|nr:hypothetical protein EVAR_29336_1 [Eumeta japonica]